MIALPEKWFDTLLNQRETGMGYYIVTVLLRDGRRYERVVIDSGYISRVYGYREIPFAAKDIVDIVVTHDTWNFRKER